MLYDSSISIDKSKNETSARSTKFEYRSYYIKLYEKFIIHLFQLLTNLNMILLHINYHHIYIFIVIYCLLQHRKELMHDIFCNPSYILKLRNKVLHYDLETCKVYFSCTYDWDTIGLRRQI